MRFCDFSLQRFAPRRAALVGSTLALILLSGCGGEPQRADSDSTDSQRPVPPADASATDGPSPADYEETDASDSTTAPATSSTDVANDDPEPPLVDLPQPADDPSGVESAGEQLLFDFDRTTLSADWTATGKIRAAQKALPAALEFQSDRPYGNGLSVTTEGDSSLQCKSGRMPNDWRGFREISFWVYRSAQESEKRDVSIVDVNLYEADGKTRFSRRVDLSHVGWERITIPLRWFRWGSDRIAQWDRINRLQIWFRGPAEIGFDTITLTKGEGPHSADRGSDDLRWIAFPNGGGRLLESGHAVVITDADQLNIELLSGHLGQVAEAVSKDFPFFESISIPSTLIVFSSREDFQAFVPRFGQQFNAVAQAPKSGGYSMMGVSLSFWDEEFGSLRPVYTHEYIHGVISRGALLPSKGEWFHEGTATLYQLQFHPQDGFPTIVKKGLGDARLHLPLAELCNGNRIPINRYWQALTVVETLLQNQRYRQQLPELLDAFRQEGSTNIGPHLKTVLSTDWESLTTDWRDFCEQKYGARAEKAEPATPH